VTQDMMFYVKPTQPPARAYCAYSPPSPPLSFFRDQTAWLVPRFPVESPTCSSARTVSNGGSRPLTPSPPNGIYLPNGRVLRQSFDHQPLGSARPGQTCTSHTFSHGHAAGDPAFSASLAPCPAAAMPCPHQPPSADSCLQPPPPNPPSGPTRELPPTSIPYTAARAAGFCATPAGRWSALSLGDGHAAAITARGEVLTWGRDTRGQCGHGRAIQDDESRPESTFVRAPQLVHFPTALPRVAHLTVHVRVRAVTCGGEHTLAIATGGVFAWGCNALGQCGLGDGAPDTVPRPIAVPGLRALPVCQLAAGLAHSLALTASSQVLSWGDGASGQLGLGDRQTRRAPAVVEALWALPVVQIAAGDAHSAAVTSSGHAFAWGCNYFGQLGLLPESEPGKRGAGQGQQAAGEGGHEPKRGMQEEACDQEPAVGTTAAAGSQALLPAITTRATAGVEGHSGALRALSSGGRDVGRQAAVAAEARSCQEQRAGQQPSPLFMGRDLGSPRTPRGCARGAQSCGGGHPNLSSPRAPRTPFTPGSAMRAALR
jgi:hypothetical protein